MVHDELENRYFEWLYQIVCGDNIYSRLSYRKLLMFLHRIQFTYSIKRDENRAQDGICFRYRFGCEKGYSDEIISKYLDNRRCSVLEMMVALANRGEEEIMDDYDYGNRTGQWFWGMIVSLGLGTMNDDEFNENYAYSVIRKFLDREYEPNGRGGLFTIENCKYDMRTVEIWAQFMWYLDLILEESEGRN